MITNGPGLLKPEPGTHNETLLQSIYTLTIKFRQQTIIQQSSKQNESKWKCPIFSLQEKHIKCQPGDSNSPMKCSSNSSPGAHAGAGGTPGTAGAAGTAMALPRS